MTIDFTKDKLTGRIIEVKMRAEAFEEERILGMILEGVEQQWRFLVKGVGMFRLLSRENEDKR